MPTKLSLLAALLLLAACSHHPPSPPLPPRPISQAILPANSSDPAIAAQFKARLATFHLTEDAAEKIAEEAYFDRQKQGLPVEGFDKHALALVGDNFLFAKPHKTKTVLKGYLVNALTGDVHWFEMAQPETRNAKHETRN